MVSDLLGSTSRRRQARYTTAARRGRPRGATAPSHPESHRLIAIVEQGGGSRSSVAPANVADYRVDALESLAASHVTEMDLSEGGRPETLFAHAVTHEFFAVVGNGGSRGSSWTDPPARIT